VTEADTNKETAEIAIKLLERTNLKGDEVAAFIRVNQLLGGIAQGQLVVSKPPAPKKTVK